jgi:hypothetical protein
MTPNRKTQKPDRPLSVLVFPKTGRPYMRVEHPPRDQKGLEFALGSKFIGALAHFQGIRLSKLTICPESEEPGDLTCVDEKGRAIKIQVAELIDHSPRRLKEMWGSYVEVAKHYSRPTEPFWLLTYLTDTLFDEQDPDIEESRHLLDSTRHPFDAVWYLYPYTNEELGDVLRVWLNQQNEIRT